MTHSLINKCAKNYYNRTFIVQVIAKNVVTCFFLRHSVLISVLMSVLQLHNDVHCFFELGRFFETFSCSVVSVISQKKSVMLNFQRWSNICLDLICLLCFVGRFRDVHSVGRSVDISRRLSSGLPGHDSTAQPLLHRQLTQHVTIYPNDVVLRLA